MTCLIESHPCNADYVQLYTARWLSQTTVRPKTVGDRLENVIWSTKMWVSHSYQTKESHNYNKCPQGCCWYAHAERH